MTLSAFFAFLHFVTAFGVFAAVFCEWFYFSRQPTHAEAVKLQRCDLWYGLFAMVVLIIGFVRVAFFEKGSAYYFSNHFFWTKLALFAAVGVLSIYPTVQFLCWRKETREGKPPVISDRQFSLIRTALNLEMLCLLGIILCASMMAKGLGSQGGL